MPTIFQEIDKIKPAHDMTYRVAPFLCKLLPVVDILITTMVAAGRYIPFTPDPAWSEEMVPTCMSYMTVLSAALVIRRGVHICMIVFDRYLSPRLVRSLGIVADLAVFALAITMITVGWEYAMGIGAKGAHVSMLKISRSWMHFPAPLAGVAMLVFEVEALCNHIKSFFVRGGME